MPTTARHQGKELYEFGPFRVDPEKEILLRAGVPIPLMPKTFQILLTLVRHGNEVVSKDDLMKTVWPDTFVEETNLTRNIFTLRKALGENPPEQRYIVTVPGRGYRLAESVRLAPESELSVVAAEYTKVQVQIGGAEPWKWIAVGSVLVIAAIAGSLRLLLRRAPVLTGKDNLVLADFANSTGDPVFDGTLRQGMSVQLEQSPFLSLVSEERIQHTLRLMGQPACAPFTPALAREVCIRTGSAAVLEGSITRMGSQYVLGLRAANCRTGRLLDEEQVQARRKEDVLKALGRIASRFRRRVGESVATIEEHNTPLPEATTPSLNALEAYSKGWKALYSRGAVAALPFFKRAIEIDPKFAAAQAAVGRVYADLDEPELAAEYMSRAWRLGERASDPERFFISGNYEMLVTENLAKAREIAETWLQTYPREPVAHLNVIGVHQQSSRPIRRGSRPSQTSH